jgi:P4 family phage/plasmid primase-like protien
MYKKGDFCNFLMPFRVEKGCEFTHTSIVKPSGAFYISSDEEDKFMEEYKRALENNEELYLTEKHKLLGSMVIDLDFRFNKEQSVVRKYSQDTITDILKCYMTAITEFFDVETVKFYVMEKPHPVMDKGLIKDGLHIIIPDIISKPAVQYIIRKKVVKDLADVINSLGVVNNIEDVVDEAVIHRNNWQMYGSKKPNCDAYKLTGIYDFSVNGEINKQIPELPDHQYVEILSIRNKYIETALKIEKLQEVEDFQKQKEMDEKKRNDKRLAGRLNTKKNTCDNIEFIGKLVDILSAERATKYDEWIRVGWCLRNIDFRLLDKWIDFSKKSSKFVDGECERIWNHMRDDGLGIGTLHMWCKQDDPEAYKKMLERDLSNLIYRSRTETHHDIAKVIHFIYKYDYVCISIKQNYWYEFKNHRWVPCDCGHTLRHRISTDVVKEYCAAAAYYNNKASLEDMEADQQRYLEDAKKLNGIALKLKQGPFKDNVMKECKELFYTEKFEEKLDSRCHLIGFENGVYDLETEEFREGRPEDYISFSTCVNYIDYEPDHPSTKDINGFLEKVFTKKDIRDYVMTVLASFLNGNIKEERFHIWTGVGSNGKSKIIELFESAFGEYCCKFPITLLTQKRAASNAASSEVARSKGKRFACLQEPSEDEKLNIGLMKELTGGDKIMARALFKEPIEFKPQFKMILTCNHLPNVPSDDGGTWRRIRVVEFTSKFKENPDPTRENEFLADTELSSKFDDWKEHFMAMLIMFYKKYKQNGIYEPDDVLKCTKEYQKNNDCYLEFLDQEVDKDERGFLSVNDAYSKFMYWIKENAPHIKGVSKKAFTASIEKTLGKCVHAHKINGWKGHCFKQELMEEDDGL